MFCGSTADHLGLNVEPELTASTSSVEEPPFTGGFGLDSGQFGLMHRVFDTRGLNEGESFSWTPDRVGVAYSQRHPVGGENTAVEQRNTGVFVWEETVAGSFTVVRGRFHHNIQLKCGDGAVASPGMMGNGRSDRDKAEWRILRRGRSFLWFRCSHVGFVILVCGGVSASPHGFSWPFSSSDRNHGYCGDKTETAASLPSKT